MVIPFLLLYSGVAYPLISAASSISVTNIHLLRHTFLHDVKKERIFLLVIHFDPRARFPKPPARC